MTQENFKTLNFDCPKVQANSQPRFLAFALSNRTVILPASHTAAKHHPLLSCLLGYTISFMLSHALLWLGSLTSLLSPFQSEKILLQFGLSVHVGPASDQWPHPELPTTSLGSLLHFPKFSRLVVSATQQRVIMWVNFHSWTTSKWVVCLWSWC